MKSVNVLSVSELNKNVKRLLTEDPFLGEVVVQGEISGFKRHSSGHIYFTLKDESAAVRCAFFKPYSLYADKELKDGVSVRVKAWPTLFERDGQFQLNVYYVSKEGKGDLYLQYELLKKKFLEEGLFDEKYKRQIPSYVKKIGVVTSPTGAVFRDIVNVATRRCPYIQIVLAPVVVQGEDAPRSICAGIKALEEREDVDVIIVGRGGGSIEDLWCFNDENVARCIFTCKKPIVSAVGHETDFTIADFVADLRAPTPSAAAELATFDYFNTVEEINYFEKHLYNFIDETLSEYKYKLKQFSYQFTDPQQIVDKFNHKLELLSIRLADGMDLSKKQGQLNELTGKLDALSPLKVLSRGFAVVRDTEGKVIKSSTQVKKGDRLSIKLNKGEINTEVIK